MVQYIVSSYGMHFYVEGVSTLKRECHDDEIWGEMSAYEFIHSWYALMGSGALDCGELGAVPTKRIPKELYDRYCENS